MRRWFLPASIATAHFLSEQEKEALLDEMRQQLLQHPEEQPPLPTPSQKADGALAAEAPAPRGCWGRCAAPQQGQRRTLAQDWAAFKVALRCPIVWCAGLWRCLYAMAVYGLQARSEGPGSLRC